MSFIFEMDLVEGAAEDVSEDEASFCFSSDKSNNSEGPDSSSDESSLSDNKDEGFKRRALIALIAYKIIKKKKGTKKNVSDRKTVVVLVESPPRCYRKEWMTVFLGENIGCHQGLFTSWLIC
jgi:hypothetical protein